MSSGGLKKGAALHIINYSFLKKDNLELLSKQFIIESMFDIIFSGCPVGTILSMPLSGVMSKYGFDGGWASVFYCFGKQEQIRLITYSFAMNSQ